MRYALALQSGAPLPGWTSNAGSPGIGSGQGCEDNNAGGGTPKSAGGGSLLLNGSSVPGSPPIDSTASVDPNNGSLYFGGGNAAVPGTGGYYAYTSERGDGLEPGRHQPEHRHPERRGRAGLTLHR